MKPGEHKSGYARIPGYAEAEGALLGVFRQLHTDICGNQDCVIVQEFSHFSVPNHGKLLKSLMTVHLGNYQELELRLGAQHP